MESLIFQPNKKGVISGGIISVILCVGLFAYLTFKDEEFPSTSSLIFFYVFSVVVVFVYAVTVISVVRSAGYRTKIEVSQHGFTVIAPKCPEPMFIPWSEKFHMCICLEGDVYSYHWIREKILCFSNQDINGQWIEMAKTVNHRQTFETDAGQPWVVALTYGSKAKCKKDAARIQQYMQGYSQQSESKRKHMNHGSSEGIMP